MKTNVDVRGADDEEIVHIISIAISKTVNYNI